MDAARITHTLTHGLHGRRQSGTGETFWQFRRYQPGEPTGRIDWRRSAHDDHVYIREQEWEAAHTVWLWPERSSGMQWHSALASITKEHRAIVLALALAGLLVRAGERVGIPNLSRPSLSKNTPRHLAETLARMDEIATAENLPPDGDTRSFSDYVIFSDFFGDPEEIEARIEKISADGVRCHLVQILDPAEESFPFEGHMEFVGPDRKIRMQAGRAESLRTDYIEALRLLRLRLQSLASRVGGTFLAHRTDQPPHKVLLGLHGNLTAPGHTTIHGGTGSNYILETVS